MATMLIDGTKEAACRTAEANAIRAKTGGSSQINYDFTNNKGFADAINAIPRGGAYSIVQTDNGDECSLAITDSTTLILETKTDTVTTNGTKTYTPSQGYDGIGSVAVTTNVPVPEGSINITSNGTVDVTDYETANVNVPASVSINSGSMGSYNKRWCLYLNGIYLMHNDTPYKYLYKSSNGINWSEVENPVASTNILGCTDGNAIYITATSGNTNIYKTYDCITWTAVGVWPSSEGLFTLSTFIYVNNIWFVQSSSSYYKFWYSTDLNTWTEVQMSETHPIGSLFYWHGDYYVYWSIYDRASIYKSQDLINWSLYSTVQTGYGRLRKLGARFIMVPIYTSGISNSKPSYSEDLLTWTTVNMEISVYSAISGGGLLIAPGYSNICYTMDGETWYAKAFSSGSTKGNWCMYGGGKFIIPNSGRNGFWYIDTRVMIG